MAQRVILCGRKKATNITNSASENDSKEIDYECEEFEDYLYPIYFSLLCMYKNECMVISVYV